MSFSQALSAPLYLAFPGSLGQWVLQGRAKKEGCWNQSRGEVPKAEKDRILSLPLSTELKAVWSSDWLRLSSKSRGWSLQHCLLLLILPPCEFPPPGTTRLFPRLPWEVLPDVSSEIQSLPPLGNLNPQLSPVTVRLPSPPAWVL